MHDRKHTGAISEHKATVWLMQQGYEVFRNVSPHGKYDIIVRDPETDTFYPVDVTTGTLYESKTGKGMCLNYPRYKDHSKPILIVTHDDQFIWVGEGCPDVRL